MPKKTKIDAADKKILKKSFFYCLQNFLGPNDIVKQGRTFALSILPGLKAWSPDEESTRQAFERTADQFFNTNAVFFPLHAGMTLAMEKQRIATNGELSEEMISSVNAALQGPTAAIGDSIVFNCYRVIIAGIAIELSANGNLLGPLFFLVFYGLGQILMKWYTLKLGFTYGSTIVNKAFNQGIIPLLTEAASILGGIMIGVILASRININIALVPNIFGATVDIQALLDTLMPGLLSLVLWWFSFKALKKGWSPIRLIFTIMLGCIILTFFGVL